jgi:hypothetical protein
MTTQIILYNDNVGLNIVYPALECGLTVEEIAQKDIPKEFEYRIVENTVLPASGKFRQAWVSTPDLTGVVVDFVKAKEVAHQMRRWAREKALNPLDTLVNYNISNPTKLAEIEANRESIRIANAELQIAIDGASTVVELEQLTDNINLNGLASFN